VPPRAGPSASSATVALTVTDADTAISLRSGDVAVLGTPRIVALCEEATCAAMGPQLDAGETTVGTRVEIAHLLAVAVGEQVVAEATLERTEGRRLTFTVSVTSEKGLVAAGKISRAVVNRKEFLDKTA
jgi:fluoroacetyl-CoA thioesterase